MQKLVPGRLRASDEQEQQSGLPTLSKRTTEPSFLQGAMTLLQVPGPVFALRIVSKSSGVAGTAGGVEGHRDEDGWERLSPKTLALTFYEAQRRQLLIPAVGWHQAHH